MDELRTEIWDLLFKAARAKSVDEIAADVNRDTDTIRAAIDHDWFQIDGDLVTIAQSTPSL